MLDSATASLRWGDLLWVPPDRLQLQLSHGAILGTAVRTKTTNRSMPFGFLIFGLSGTPSVNWGIKFHHLLRQALADTLSRQPGRVIDFLPARLGVSDLRPLLLDPCQRHLAVPRLLALLSRHWAANSPSPPPAQFTLYGAHSCKATVLSWSRQMSLDRTLRRIQGHHRLSGADRSVELYDRDDIRPMLDLARGSSTAFPPSPPPPLEAEPSPTLDLTALEDAMPSPVDSVSSASASSEDSGPETIQSLLPVRIRSHPLCLVRTWPPQQRVCIFIITALMWFMLLGLHLPRTRPAPRTRSMQSNFTVLPVVPAPTVTAWNLSAALCHRALLHACTVPVVQPCLPRV